MPLVDYHTAQVPSSGTGRNRRQFATRRDELLAVPRAELNTILSRRDYRVDALYTIALWARPEAPHPLAELAARLHEPVFALYLGRKSCPPGLPLTAQVLTADNILDAMDNAALPLPDDFARRLVPPNTRPALYWDEDGEAGSPVEHTFTRRDAVYSRRRWQFQSRSEHHAALPVTGVNRWLNICSPVSSRADLGWSQVEKFARLDSYGQHQAVWQLFDLPPATEEGGCVSFSARVAQRSPGVLHPFLQCPAGPCWLVEHSIETLCTSARSGRPAPFQAACKPGRDPQRQTP